MDLKLIDRFSDRLYAALVCSCRLFLAADAHVGDIVIKRSEGATSDDDQVMARVLSARQNSSIGVLLAFFFPRDLI